MEPKFGKSTQKKIFFLKKLLKLRVWHTKTTNIQGLHNFTKTSKIDAGFYDFNHKIGKTYRINVIKGTCESLTIASCDCENNFDKKIFKHLVASRLLVKVSPKLTLRSRRRYQETLKAISFSWWFKWFNSLKKK